MTDKIYIGDALDVLKTLPDESFDSCVTDPPYGLKFMGKKWDYNVPSVAVWTEVLRVLKPGAHILSFGGTRTYHRLVVNIEDAGLEIRDTVMWVYGSGFPKSLDVSKAIDKAAGAEREVIGPRQYGDGKPCHYVSEKAMRLSEGKCQSGRTTHNPDTAPATDAARQWEGWGTALKPACELICLARKPFKGTVAQNVLQYGTGAINIDGCRIETGEECARKRAAVGNTATPFGRGYEMGGNGSPLGRWPANVIHDGSEEVIEYFPETSSGELKEGKPYNHNNCVTMGASSGCIKKDFPASEGSAARFFYTAKASRSERNRGCDGLEEHNIVTFATHNGTSGKPSSISEGRNTKYRNNHPTVKPIALMTYLVRLITPPKGIVLDPYFGSGSTGIACTNEGFNFVGIDRDGEYAEIARRRNSTTMFCQPEVIKSLGGTT